MHDILNIIYDLKYTYPYTIQGTASCAISMIYIYVYRVYECALPFGLIMDPVL